MTNKHWLTKTFPSICDGCPERQPPAKFAKSLGESDPVNFFLNVETHDRLVRLTGQDRANTSKSEILRAMIDLTLPIFEENPNMVKILRQELCKE